MLSQLWERFQRFFLLRNLDKFERTLLKIYIDSERKVKGTVYTDREIYEALLSGHGWPYNLTTNQLEAAIISCRGHLEPVGDKWHWDHYIVSQEKAHGLVDR